VLVTDIERGGVFASIIGTMSLLTPDERRFCGFHQQVPGDPHAFESGAPLNRRPHAVPRVFLYADDIGLDAKTVSRSTRAVALPLHGRPDFHRPLPTHLQRRISGCCRGRIDEPPPGNYDFACSAPPKHTFADLEWLRDGSTRGFEQHRRADRDRRAAAFRCSVES
jgi:hypothetical protein